MSSRRRYHHGDLRRALVDAAIALLDEHGDASALSLREVARRAGVTTGAPYHHFATRADLLVELAIEGFAALSQALAPVDLSAASPELRLRRRIETYMRFALAHRAHYRVMFAPELATSARAPEYERVARDGFASLAAAVGAVRPGLAAADVFGLARSAWAGAHGFVMLAADGTVERLGGRANELERALRLTARHLTAMVVGDAERSE